MQHGIDLEEQNVNVKNAKVEFDAYFQNGNGESVHSKEINVEGEENLYLKLKVEEGYLSSGSIKIENANFKVQETSIDLDKIQSVSSSKNEIILNQINKDESVILQIPVKMNTESNLSINDLNKVASVKLEGTYVNKKGKEVKLNKAIEVEVIFDGEAKNNLSGEVSKYVKFDVNGQKGVILQTLIKSNLIDNKLPVKSTKLEMEIPVINNIEPKTITLSAKSLMATNGMGVKVFSEEDYKYEDGKVILTIENNKDILSWEKNVIDEIILTCVYDETAITEIVDLNLKSNATIAYYAKEVKETSAETVIDKTLKEQIGDIVTLDIETSEDLLYKGYMLEEKGKDTEFIDNLSLNIGYSELMDKIIFKDETSYRDEKGNLYPSNTLYKYSKISKDNLVEILGENGYIKIYNNVGELITTLNKENLEYTFEDGIYGITFETSKPERAGILKVENARRIKNLEYSKAQEELFTGFNVTLDASVQKSDAVIIKGNKTKEIKLEKPKTNAILNLSNSNLSTVVTNENVELRVTLDTKNASSNLYKDPEVTIVLPSNIKDIKIENVKLLYEKELKISDAKIFRNENGNLVINIKLNGEQKIYNENWVTMGATLIMNADITVNPNAPTSTQQVHLSVKNAKTNDEVVQDLDIKFVAPAGIATVNEISGFSDENKSAVSISSKIDVGEVKTNSSAKNANVKVTAINNYTYDCDNIVILGRTPSEGNKKITTNEELGSTFSLEVDSGIKSENGLTADQMKVYYSENKEATKNLNDSDNAWKEDISQVENVESYMIVLDDYTFKSGETLGFNYDVKIPENLSENEETYGVFAVYYERAEEDSQNEIAALGLNRSIVQESSPVGLASMQMAAVGVPNLNVSLSAEANSNPLGASVEELETVSFKARLTNNGAVDARNVDLVVDLTKNVKFISQNGTPFEVTLTNENGEVITNQNGTPKTKEYINIPVRKYWCRRNKGNKI